MNIPPSSNNRRRHLLSTPSNSPIVGSAGSAMTVELELSSSESPSEYETTAEDLLLSTSFTTAGSLSPTSPHHNNVQVEAVEQQFQMLDLDMQGIPWGRANVSREQFRANRIATYLQYEEDRRYRTAKEVPLFDDSCQYYRFKYMSRFEACSVQHFQLKHLLHCPTPFSLFYPLYNRIKQFQPLRPDQPSVTALNLTERFGASFSRISTFLATPSVVLVGGLFGEVVTWRWHNERSDEEEECQFSVCPDSDPSNAVVNHISMQNDINAIIACNDGTLRSLDLTTNSWSKLYSSQWAINAAQINPIFGQFLALVGDDPQTVLLDTQSNHEIARLSGHDDCSFSVAWRPDGLHLATANQDRTVIVRDIRRLDVPLVRRRTFMSVPRSLRYHRDGLLLTIANADDYVHIVDTTSYEQGQVIDFFGDIAGIDFGCGEDDHDRLYVGCANPHQGGIICFERQPPR